MEKAGPLEDSPGVAWATYHEMEDIVGEEYCEVDEISGCVDPNFSKLSKKDLCAVREDISATLRPSWHAAPPTNLGESSHGKLKADQWRLTIEFDLPVSLVHLYMSEGFNKSISQEQQKRRQLQVKSIMLLGMAIRWGTSHQMSTRHASEYKRYIMAYLHSLQQLLPDRDLLLNHHNAVHYGYFLPSFGPSHSWWMFPFEWVIGLLQKINTNNKIDE